MQLFLSNNERRIARRNGKIEGEGEGEVEEQNELVIPDDDLLTEEEKEERERKRREEEELLNMPPDFVKEIMSILPKDSSNNTIELGKLVESVAHFTTFDDLVNAESAENAERQEPKMNGASQGGE